MAATHKAVYCYPLAHYEYWKGELPGRELPTAIFGENFMIDACWPENSVHLAAREFSVGSAEVIVTQPRLPCYKLGIRFESALHGETVPRQQRPDRFLPWRTREGEVGAGDDIAVLARDPQGVSIAEITGQMSQKDTASKT